MTTLVAPRTHAPLWLIVPGAGVAWLVAWLVNLPLASWLAHDVLGLEAGSRVGDAVAFFLYDMPKVMLLLAGIVTVVAFLRSFVSPERVRHALAGRGVLPGTLAAAGFGVVTPFCSRLQPVPVLKESAMHVIEVLGPGCQKCRYTEKIVREVMDAAGIGVEVRHVTDYAEIASRGVMSTPAVVLDGTVVLAGRVPTREQVATWLGVASAYGSPPPRRRGMLVPQPLGSDNR